MSVTDHDQDSERVLEKRILDADTSAAEGALPSLRTKQHVGLRRIDGPIVFVEGVSGVGYDEAVELILPTGESRHGRVLQASTEGAVIEVWTGTAGLDLSSVRVRFSGSPLRIPVAREMLGRVMSGLGRPIDGLGAPVAEDMQDINGRPINVTRRHYPRNLIVTGISAIDGMNTLIRGQKLPIFSGSGMPHNQLAAQIARQAHIGEAIGTEEAAEGTEAGTGRESSGTALGTGFAVVFCAIGIKHDDAEFFRRSFEESNAILNTAMFLNLADDPPMERIMAPRTALTLAEFLAFEHGMHVLVIMTDMTNYGEALRELASRRGEVPSRKGYPGYLYSDLASLYERTGIIEGREGSITQVPILTMPNDDISHPIPDLTGYITEGQIVLGRDLYRNSIYPPINVLPSLSRLMKDGIGKGYTREDHPAVADQLYAAYSQVQDVRSLRAVIGEEELSDVDQRYIEFGNAFERRFVNQRQDESRSIEQTLDLAWEILRILPESELTRLSEQLLDKYYRTDDEQE